MMLVLGVRARGRGSRFGYSNVEAGVDIVLMTAMEFEKKRDWWSTPVYSAVREGKIVYERV